jgi:DivIVA domain-containing protein
MPSPDEIELKTFPVTLRGFDQIEVTRFLETVAAQLGQHGKIVDRARHPRGRWHRPAQARGDRRNLTSAFGNEAR